CVLLRSPAAELPRNDNKLCSCPKLKVSCFFFSKKKGAFPSNFRTEKKSQPKVFGWLCCA
ncbi:MAG: hypothetical protein Q4B50_08670, partial [Bacillota bacterium]|nr:hypothetical protein [Bacillota bacterium]